MGASRDQGSFGACHVQLCIAGVIGQDAVEIHEL